MLGANSKDWFSPKENACIIYAMDTLPPLHGFRDQPSGVGIPLRLKKGHRKGPVDIIRFFFTGKYEF